MRRCTGGSLSGATVVAIERRSSFQSFLRLVVRELLFSGIEHVLFLEKASGKTLASSKNRRWAWLRVLLAIRLQHGCEI